MYIFSFIAFSISKPWKKEFYTNIRFMIALICVFTYSSLIVVVPAARFSLLQIFGMTNKVVTLYVLLVAIMFGMVMYINQKFVL